MIVYTVHEQPSPPADRIERGAALQFIADRFSWGAAIFGPFWLLAQRAWLPLAAYVGIVAVITTGLAVAGAPDLWIGLATAAVNIALGFEGASIHRLALEGRGWKPLGTVTGRNRDDCERRFFDGWLAPAAISREQEFIGIVEALRGESGAQATAAPGSDSGKSTLGARLASAFGLRR